MRTLFALLTCLSIINLALADDDDDDVKPSKANNDASKLQLASPTEKLAGIKTQALQAAQQQAEFSAFGKVVSLEPLLQLRQQYLAANAQQQSAKARYTEAQLNLTRTQNLHSQDIVSSRRLQEQQAQSLADRANLDASAYQQQTLLENSKLEWGSTLSSWLRLATTRKLNNS
jgi:multidrug resistance efflux pump